MRRLLKPATLLPLLAGFLFGVVLNLVTEAVAGAGSIVIGIVLVAAAVVGIAMLWLQMQPKRIDTSVRAPITFTGEFERVNYARRGVITFVSLYRPAEGSPAWALSEADRMQAIAAGDYDKLAVEQSNLATAVSSVWEHRYRVEQCWLVSTTSADNSQIPGSFPSARLVASYLREEKGLRKINGREVTYHGVDDLRYAVPLDNDAEVAIKTRDLINRIFDEAHSLGLSDKEIVADFTGCPRSMTLGMIWACLSRSRDIQFAGTHYDQVARPVGDLHTILFDFEAQVDDPQ